MGRGQPIYLYLFMFILHIHADAKLGEATRSQALAEADNQPRGASCSSFLMHSLRIPGRNLGIFALVFALNVAYVGFADHAYSLAQDGELRPNDMAAAYLLCAFLGPAVRVVTASAAVAACSESEQHALAWRPLIAETLRGSVKAAGPVATVVDGKILLLATQAGGAVALLLLQALIMWNCCQLTLQLIDLLVALHDAHRLLQGYVRAVSSLAVVVLVSSQSQPAACHGRAALGRAWRLSREDARRTAVLVATEGVVAGAISQWYESAVVEHELEYSWYVYVLLSGAALLFSACVAAAFYYQCPQSADADPVTAGGGGWRQPWARGTTLLCEQL